MESGTPTFMTIRQVARTGLISEHYLRVMERRGELPGIRTGNTFRVNYGMLVDQLNRESMANSQGGAGQQ